MRNRGILTKWNDDRGFGFIKHSETETIFIHISAVQLMPRRPKEGDILFYDIIQDSAGKKKAASVTIEGLEETIHRAKNSRDKNPPIFSYPLVLFIIVFSILAYYLKTHYFSDNDHASTNLLPQENVRDIEVDKVERTFICQGKTYCSQMTSCEEARLYLENCPNQNTDGDGDGEPCESQWCN